MKFANRIQGRGPQLINPQFSTNWSSALGLGNAACAPHATCGQLCCLSVFVRSQKITGRLGWLDISYWSKCAVLSKTRIKARAPFRISTAPQSGGN